ncbi:BLOC-2 complex member HPS5 homolog isoform X4 [Sitodiplosis mosellana]|uniref:BLOC-2 complex member HPS5 homolog isoform X4 n=1 Tax=Sitodiplosis mosellana TaxID=263140 RepID=UPI00244386CC|nr:BLOC-2 complex member HPS5 homolog isoform X4 [Sitodiplosis mosellana]
MCMNNKLLTTDASEINSHIIMEESYELCNLTELTLELKKPLYVTRRINYTCYDVSKNYIVCGATSGSIYLFRRCPVSLLQLIPNLNGPIKLVAISPLEQYICFTTQRGAINVYILNFSTLQPIISSYYLHEMNITQIKWKQNENQIYFGDIKGNVFLVNLNNFLGKNSLNISVHPILFLESPIVQICEYEDLLLVSNFTKCILCNTITEEYKQNSQLFHTYEFWKCLASRFILLHDEMAIQCIRCRAYSKVNCIDPEYSYDNVFHHCLLFLPPISVLMLLNELANLIPSDAISRKLYVKCLLNVS